MVELKDIYKEMQPFYDKIVADKTYMIPKPDLQTLILLSDYEGFIEKALLEAVDTPKLNLNQLFAMLGVLNLLITRMNRSVVYGTNKDRIISRIEEAIIEQLYNWTQSPEKEGMFTYYLQGVYETVNILMYP